MTTSEHRAEDLDRDIREILVQSAGVDRTALAGPSQESLADLGMDSLAAMELQSIVKTEYAVELPDELLERSVPEIVGLVRSALQGAR